MAATGQLAPLVDADGHRRQVVQREPADVAGLERVGLQLAADGPAVEHQRVQRDAGEAAGAGRRARRCSCTTSHSMPVSSCTSFTATSRGRVADVGPPGRVEPHAGVGPLDQQDLALVVADHGADRHLRGLVAGHARGRPTSSTRATSVVGVVGAAGGDPHVGGDGQHLLEALLLVEALGEARGRCGRCPPAPRSTAPGPVASPARSPPPTLQPVDLDGRRGLSRANSSARRISSRYSRSVTLCAVAVAHVERVDGVAGEGLHLGRGDVEVELVQGPGDAAQHTHGVGRPHLEHGVGVRRARCRRSPRGG